MGLLFGKRRGYCRRPSYIAREQTTKKTRSPIPILLYDVITGTDPKEKTVPPIVALPSNGCKQAFPLFTVDLQRARHNIKPSYIEVNKSTVFTKKYHS
jgi:hypothetical protein